MLLRSGIYCLGLDEELSVLGTVGLGFGWGAESGFDAESSIWGAGCSGFDAESPPFASGNGHEIALNSFEILLSQPSSSQTFMLAFSKYSFSATLGFGFQSVKFVPMT